MRIKDFLRFFFRKKMQIMPKIAQSMCDTLGKSYSKHESHSWMIVTVKSNIVELSGRRKKKNKKEKKSKKNQKKKTSAETIRHFVLRTGCLITITRKELHLLRHAKRDHGAVEVNREVYSIPRVQFCQKPYHLLVEDVFGIWSNIPLPPNSKGRLVRL